ncbi:MAG: MBOAT family protein [Clostridiales bacterium]|nr:MBOAT family protein [Clostridiales bacterium]
MLFNSYVFMLAFLPLTLLVYFLLGRLPERIQLNKLFLVLASFVFYGYNNPNYVPIIVFSILINYALSQMMLASEKKILRLPLMVLGLGLNLGVLFYFKYHDFFASNMNAFFGTNWALYRLALPLGISFFTFQQLSYVIDSYRRTVPRYNILDYALFVTFFPQLVAGPIVLHSEIVPQFADKKNRHFNFDNFAPGLYAFALGLFKKVIVADTFGIAVEAGFADALSLNTVEAWFVAIGYTLQLYFDFSGYCDVATGVGLMFNIRIPLNFNSPYKSLNIREFWQRWHITLSRFLTNYIYFPLGGNRKGTLRTYVNLMVVFLASGLWHGAGWLFLLWGLMHGAASVAYRIFRKQYDDLHPALQWILTFGFVIVAWVFFRATSLTDALAIVKSMLMMDFGPIRDSITTAFALPGGIRPGYNAIFMMAWYVLSLFACLGMKNTYEKTMAFRPTIWNALMTVILILYVTLSLSKVSVFLYFNF